MQKIILFLLILLITSVFSQENEAKNIVDDFFIAFHKKDTIQLRTISYKDIVMQTIATKKDGNSVLVTENFTDFLKSIASIPKDMKFEERLLEYKIQYDGSLIHVWTPYEFYVNGKLSHKGVNSFTLVKENEKWLIVHIIDTRHK